MDKLIKIWKLKDNITNMEMVFSCRDDACDFEHSDTEIHEGYFVTKEQLVDIYKCGLNNGVACAFDRSYIKAEEFLKLNYGVE